MYCSANKINITSLKRRGVGIFYCNILIESKDILMVTFTASLDFRNVACSDDVIIDGYIKCGKFCKINSGLPSRIYPK